MSRNSCNNYLHNVKPIKPTLAWYWHFIGNNWNVTPILIKYGFYIANPFQLKTNIMPTLILLVFELSTFLLQKLVWQTVRWQHANLGTIFQTNEWNICPLRGHSHKNFRISVLRWYIKPLNANLGKYFATRMYYYFSTMDLIVRFCNKTTSLLFLYNFSMYTPP